MSAKSNSQADRAVAETKTASAAERGESLALTVDALLQDLARIHPEKDGLAISGPDRETTQRLESIAAQHGWAIAKNRDEIAVALEYFPERDPDGNDPDAFPEGTRAILRVESRERSGVSPPPAGFTGREPEPLNTYHTINAWLGEIARRRNLPDTWKTRCRRWWRRLGFSESVGSRLVSRPDAGSVVIFFTPVNGAGKTPWLPDLKPSFADRVKAIAVTFFGSGNIRYFPGTWGAFFSYLLALGLWWVVADPALFRGLSLVIVIASTAACVILEPWIGRFYHNPDPREVVLDEVAGTFMAYLFLPAFAFTGSFASVSGLLFLGFLLFRVFDIFKIGVHWVECRHWRGAIVWDDLLSGVYAGLLTLGAAWLLR